MPRLRRRRPPGGYAYLLHCLSERARDQAGFYDRKVYARRLASMRAAEEYWRRVDGAAWWERDEA